MKVYQTVFIGEKNTLLYGRIYLDKEKAIKFLKDVLIYETAGEMWWA